MEVNKQWEMSPLSAKLFIETTDFFAETLLLLSSLASHPLFSIFIALYTLILLYFPQIFLDLIFSPILISTGILLSTLLRLGSSQTSPKEDFSPTPQNENLKLVTWEAETGKDVETEPSFFSESFLEWNLRAPLEVIYEECEGEEENNQKEKEETIQRVSINELVSLAIYYPESDTGSSSDGEFPAVEGWDSPENMCFWWDGEDKEGLIEIPLDGKRSSFFQVEEENLIEIDISPIGATA